MFHSSLARSLWFIVLVIAQALVFNHIHLFGYATPMPYVFVLRSFVTARRVGFMC